MLQDNLEVKGALRIELFGPDGEIKETKDVENLVVLVGKEFITSRMKDATASVMSHMAVGTSSTAAASGDTALGAEAGRAALTSTTVTSNNIAYVTTFAAGVGTGVLKEAGLFNNASGGTMLCRTVFGDITKGAADTLSITWTVTVN